MQQPQNENRPRRSSWTRVVAVTSLVVAVAAAVVTVSCSGLQQKKTLTQAERVALGERLTFVGGCNDCHTPGTFYGNPDTNRVLSGTELGWEGPWGVTYPRNLTPDMETGIGSWTEDDIVRAIRTGQRPDKSPLLPPMPWPMYSHMTDEEAYAVAAYLKTLPPVTHKVPDRQAPGAPATGPRLTFPPPPAWDMAHAAPADTSAGPQAAQR